MLMKPENQRRAAAYLLAEIRRLADRPLRFMEVCGSHTVAIFKAGIRQLLPPQVELVSGPGCPVCVTPNDYLDTAIAYSCQPDVIIATFGDMLRVPGSDGTLSQAKTAGADIRVVYSPFDCLELAQANPQRNVIFLAVGFETTAPVVAATIQAAQHKGLRNFFALTAHKLVPPVLAAVMSTPGLKVDGFLLPGHVSTVIGEQPYSFLGDEYGVPGVIAGFDPLDILQAVATLARCCHDRQPALINQYRQVVMTTGNELAQQTLAQVFTVADTAWRGFGVIAQSGLVLNEQFAQFDARRQLPVEPLPAAEPAGCRCGEVLCGLIRPPACPLFGTVCTPDNPTGACMVSVEGTCAAWYKYGKMRWQVE